MNGSSMRTALTTFLNVRRIGTRLGLSIGTLLTLCVVIGLVSFFQTRTVGEKIREITEVREPINSSVYLLENRIVESGYAVLGYLSSGQQQILHAYYRNEEELKDMSTLMSELLARKEGEPGDSALLDMIQQFRASAEGQLALNDLQTETLDTLLDVMHRVDALLVGGIQAGITADDPIAFRRLQVAQEMGASINAVTTNLGYYLITGRPRFEAGLQQAGKDFSRRLAIYQHLLLTSTEEQMFSRLRPLRSRYLDLVSRTVELKKRQTEELASFIALRQALKAQLLKQLQARTEQGLATAKQEVLRAGTRANVTILLMLLVALGTGVYSSIVASRHITQPIQRLVSVMQAIAGGDFEKRAAAESAEELHSLSNSFNRMTDRLVQTNHELAEKELHFRTIFERSPIGIALLDRDRTILQTSPALRTMFGYSEDELRAAPGEILFRAAQKKVGPRNAPFLSAGRDRRGFHRELEAFRRGGEQLWVNVHFSPIGDGTEGSLCYILLIEDISARRLAEAEMRLMTHTIKSLSESVFICDPENRIVLVNPAFCTSYGYTETEVIGKPIRTLSPENSNDQSQDSSWPEIQSGRWSGETTQVRKNGEEFPVLLSISTVRDDAGTPVALVGIARDISEKRRLENKLEAAERQRMDDLRRYVDSVQQAQEEERRRISRELHDDICQRLTGMKLRTEVLEDDIPATSRRARRDVATFSKELDDLIADVRRISSNLRPSVLDDFGLTSALKLLCKNFERHYKIRASFHHESSLPVRFDPAVETACYRIVQEAFSNVAQHSGASRIKVSLESRDGTLMLSLQDNGKGTAFPESSTQRTKQRGLGLVGMRERAQMLGGQFRFVSNAGTGTTIEVTFPPGGTTL